MIEPLGKGGFGEVWKCEAPGGLHKAVKFVAGDPDKARGEGEQLRQEFEAFQQIKSIRHPFLLTLERVELLGDELVMVMELADCQLHDRFRQCQEEGLIGIPRCELLGYLADAAEALDVIGTKFNLAHLDIKPANLFLTSGHVKVGDYGLVSRLEVGGQGTGTRGLTPRYVAPEVLRGRVDPRSDQYSLALVYQELLTGTFPYTGRTPPQMMMQHMSAKPDLSGLPECDRVVVGLALSKSPEDRFPSCLEFIRILMSADPETASDPGLALRQERLDRSAAAPNSLTGRHSLPAEPGSLTGRHSRPDDGSSNTGRHRLPADSTQNVTLGTLPRLTQRGNQTLPPLVAAKKIVPISRPAPPPPPPKPSLDDNDDDLLMAEAEPERRLDPIRSVVRVDRLAGFQTADANLDAHLFASAVVEAAAAGGHIPQMSGDFRRSADGNWICDFPTTIPVAVIPHKLGVVKDQFGIQFEQPDPLRITYKKAAPSGLWGSKKGGMEVTITLPAAGRSIGQVIVTGGLYGTTDANFNRAALNTIPRLIEGIRRELKNVDDRRKQPRLPADLPVTIYPIHADGRLEDPIPGRCRDVSSGGVCFVTSTRVPSTHVFIAFDGVVATAGLAILVRLIRAHPLGREHLAAGPYRVDF